MRYTDRHRTLAAASCCAAAVLAMLAVAFCQKSVSDPEPVRLHVSAVHGLHRFEDARHQGATAYARDLVYLTRPYDHWEPRGDTQVWARPYAPPPDLHKLCALFCIPKASRVWRDGEYCVIEFGSRAARDQFLGDGDQLEVGPFRLATQQLGDPAQGTRGYLELESACDKTGVDIIRIEEMTVEEEWKALYGDKIHVVPVTSIVNQPRFANMGSATLIALPATTDMAIIFNRSRPIWSSRDARRRVAAVIQPHVISDVACRGDRRCTIAAAPALPPGAPVDLPGEISLLALASESSMARAASAIAFHANQDGVPIRAVILPLQGLLERLKAGRYDLFMNPVPHLETPRDVERLRYILKEIAHYRDCELARAATGSVDSVMAFVAEEVSLVRLYTYPQFAAIDSRFCPAWLPNSAASWRWMSSIHLCHYEGSP